MNRPGRCDRCGTLVYFCTNCEVWHHDPRAVESEGEYDCTLAGGPIVIEVREAEA